MNIEQIIRDVEQLATQAITVHLDALTAGGTKEQYERLYNAAVRLGDVAFIIQNQADVKYAHRTEEGTLI